MATNGTSGHRQQLALAQPGSSGAHFITADALPPVSQELKLTCLACGQKGIYDVGRILLSPETHSYAETKSGSERTPVAFANYFHCENCSSPGPWNVADYLKMLGLTVRTGLSLSEERISIGELRLFDGTTIQTPALGERHLLRLLERDPRNAFLHTRLGNLLRSCGQTTRAAQSYRDALQLDPDDLEARYHLFDYAADNCAVADAVLHAAQLARSLLTGRKHPSEEMRRGMAHAFVHALRCAPDEFNETFAKPMTGPEPPEHVFIRTLLAQAGDETAIVCEATERLLTGEAEPRNSTWVTVDEETDDRREDPADLAEDEPECSLDLVPSLRELVQKWGLNYSNLSVAVEITPEGKICLSDRKSVRVFDGERFAHWGVPSLRELWRGNQLPLVDMDKYPQEYCGHFYFLEKHLLSLCEAVSANGKQGDPTDQELEAVYSALRRRPDGRSLGLTHDFLWQIASLMLGTRALSQAQFEAIFGQLEHSVRNWALRPVSRHYVQFLREQIGD